MYFVRETFILALFNEAWQQFMQFANPWTASKNDRTSKIIVTLLFNVRFQKYKNPVEADEILFEKLFVSYPVTFIPEKSRSR